VTFADQWAPPPPDLLATCAEVVLVRAGAQAAFQAALRQTALKWGVTPDLR
jgi:hypothetical protein